MGARILPGHFKRNGRPKHGYAAESEAMRARQHPRERVYRCSFCGLWHRASPRPRSAD